MVEEQRVAETAKMYEPCVACSVARAKGDFEEAVSCRSCKGTGILRTRESWVCNACGGCLCPGDSADHESPHGLVEAKVSGGYSSPALSDCTNYAFSICEACLRKIFDGFAVKPKISDYMIGVAGGDDVATDEQYEEEAAARKKADEENEASKAEFFKLYGEARCADHDKDPASKNGNALKEYCMREGAGRLLYENSDWPYSKRWLCSRHLRDAFVSRGTTIEIPGREPLTWAARSKRGLELLAEFRGGNSPVVSSEEDAAIAISTLFPLLMSKKHGGHAARELARISLARPQPAKSWASHRIPLSFRPGHDEIARLVNDWLTWGKQQEYDNAVATAFLRYDARTIWDDGDDARNMPVDGMTDEEAEAAQAKDEADREALFAMMAERDARKGEWEE